MSDMSLKLLHSKHTHNKPEFERTETSTERNLPMLEKKQRKDILIVLLAAFIPCILQMKVQYHKICSSRGVFMSEVKRINSKRLLELEFILYPGIVASHHISQ